MTPLPLLGAAVPTDRPSARPARAGLPFRLGALLRNPATIVASPRLVWGLAALYLVAVAALTLYDFRIERQREIARIDATMRGACHALDELLGLDFHDRHTPEAPIAPEEYQRLMRRLNRLARELGLEYVYSMTRRGPQVYFVVSNETRDDSLRNTPSRFYNPYPKPPAQLIEAFESKDLSSIHFAAYTNIWNSYYSVFIPRESPHGMRYILAADIKLEDQKAILARCVYRDAILVLLLLLPLIPLVLFQRALIESRNAITARDQSHLAELQHLNEVLEATVARRTAELSLAVADLRSFSYTVSHDLRSPLQAIAGFADILRAEGADCLRPEHRGYLDAIISSSNRMSRLIRVLMGLAATQYQKIAWERIDLSSLAREVVAELAMAGDVHGAEITIADGTVVSGDPELLRLVLQNLFSNAFKYSRGRTPPRVVFSGGGDRDADWFEIEDNGVGFEASKAAEMFKPFERLHASDFEGFGIGLTHVARIVERHGGSIEVTGAVDQGARFRVSIPRKQPPEAP